MGDKTDSVCALWWPLQGRSSGLVQSGGSPDFSVQIQAAEIGLESLMSKASM